VLVFFAFEAYKVPFVLFLLGLPNQDHVLIYYVFTIFARTLVSFVLAREIINFQTSFSYEIGVDNNFLSYYTLSRNEQNRLLILSFVTVGCYKIFHFGISSAKIYHEKAAANKGALISTKIK
jgi:hypothetical protein